MSNKIIISSDSTSDLSKELIERYNIKTIPLKITLDDKAYIDGVEITPDDIYLHHEKTGQLPKTTATNIDECLEYFKDLTKDGNTVIHFSISSEMSSTYNNSRLAAEEVDNVYVIDSRNLSTGIGLLMIKAAQMAKETDNAEQIVEEIKATIPLVDASFVIDSLEYLYKGGRCSALSVLGANLLKLKPCIEVKDGVMGVSKKYRGKYISTLIEYANDRLSEIDNIEPDRVFITHAGCDDEVVNTIVEEVKKKNYFSEIFVTRAGCTVSSHCGRNTLGVLYIKKSHNK